MFELLRIRYKQINIAHASANVKIYVWLLACNRNKFLSNIIWFSQLAAALFLASIIILLWRLLDWFLSVSQASEISSVECGFDVGTDATHSARSTWLLQIFFLFEVELLLVINVLSGIQLATSIILIFLLFAVIEIYITGSRL